MYLHQPTRSGQVSSQAWSCRLGNAAGGVFSTARRNIPKVSTSVRQFAADAGEKDRMQHLNERLALYLTKVSELEESNKTLEHKIQGYLNKKAPEQHRDFFEELQTIDELRQQISDYFCTITRLNLEIEHAKYEAQDYQIKVEREAKLCMSSESEISTLQELQRDGEVQRAELEFELSQKEEEMAFLHTEHQENVLELRSAMSGHVSVELATADSADVMEKLHKIREECISVIEKKQRDVERWFEKMGELQVNVFEDGMQTDSNTAALRTLRKNYQSLVIELQKLQMQMSVLEQKRMETTSKYCQCLLQCQTNVNNLEGDLQRLHSDISQQGALYQQLLDIKTRLELEIAQYKKILDGEGIWERSLTLKTFVTPNCSSSSTTTNVLMNGVHNLQHNLVGHLDTQMYSGKEPREVHPSHFTDKGTGGTLVVQEQIVVSKHNRPVDSERAEFEVTQSKKTVTQTLHIDSKYSKNTTSQNPSLNLDCGNIIPKRQSSKKSHVAPVLPAQTCHVKDASKNIDILESREINTADVTSSLRGTAFEMKPESNQPQPQSTVAASQVADAQINTTERLVKTSIFEKVMSWNTPQISEMGRPDSNVELPNSAGVNAEIKTTLSVAGACTQGSGDVPSSESIANTEATKIPAVASDIAKAVASPHVAPVVVMTSPETSPEMASSLGNTSTVENTCMASIFNSQITAETFTLTEVTEKKSVETVIGTSTSEGLLNAIDAVVDKVENSITESISCQSEDEISESRVEMSTGARIVEKTPTESLLSTSTATGVESNLMQLPIPGSYVEIKRTSSQVSVSASSEVSDDSSASKIAQSVETTNSVAKGMVKSSDSMICTSPEQNLPGTGVTTCVDQSNVTLNVEVTPEVVVTRGGVGLSLMEHLARSDISSSMDQSNVAKDVLKPSTTEYSLELKSGEVGNKSLLNTDIVAHANESERATSFAEVEAPMVIAKVITTESLGNFSTEGGFPKTALSSCVVQSTEDKTTDSNVGCSSTEGLITTDTVICADASTGNIVQTMVDTLAHIGGHEGNISDGQASNRPTGDEGDVAFDTTKAFVSASAMERPLNANCLESKVVQSETQVQQRIMETSSASTADNTDSVPAVISRSYAISANSKVNGSACEGTKVTDIFQCLNGTQTLQEAAENSKMVVLDNDVEIRSTAESWQTADTPNDTCLAEAHLLESIAEVSLPGPVVDFTPTKSPSGSTGNMEDMSSSGYVIARPKRFELNFVEPKHLPPLDCQASSNSELPLAGNVGLPTYSVEAKGLMPDSHTRSVGRSSEVIIGSSVREARISQVSKRAGTELSSPTSPCSDRRLIRQQSSSSNRGSSGTSSPLLASPTGRPLSPGSKVPGSPSTIVPSSPRSPRRRLSSTGSIGPDGALICGTGMGHISSPSKPGVVNSAGTGVWITSSERTGDHGPYTISTRSRGSGDRISAYENTVSGSKISITGSGGNLNSTGSGNRICSTASGNKVSTTGSGIRISSTGSAGQISTGSGGRISSTGSGGQISSTGSGGRISSTGSGGRISSTGSGGRISSTGSGGRISSTGSGGRISSTGSGGRISSTGSGGRISSTGSGGRISSTGSGGRISSTGSGRISAGGGGSVGSTGSGGRISSTGSGSRISTTGSGSRISSSGSGGRISSAGVGNTRISMAAPTSSPTNRTVIRSTGSSGGGSSRERISVCKMAALSKAAAVKEKSQECQGLQQMKATTSKSGDENVTIIPVAP